MIMTESTGYLDMNKKNLCHPNKTNQLSFVLFFKKGIFVFQTEPNSVDRSIASNPKKPPTQIPKKHSSIHCLLLASTRKKKNFHAFFQKNFFFPPPTGIRTHIKKILVSPTACAKRAPLPPIPRARARPPPPPPPPLLLPTITTISSNRDRKKERGIEPRYRQKSDRYQTSV